MLRKIVVAAAVVAASAAIAAPSPFRATGAVVNDEGSLVVAFTQIGLPKATDISYTIKAVGRAAYACQNNGGQFPGDLDVSRQRFSVDFTLNTGTRHRVTGGQVFAVPPSDLECPAGQEVTLACIAWARVRVQDNTTPAFKRLGTFSRNFYPEAFPVCPLDEPADAATD